MGVGRNGARARKVRIAHERLRAELQGVGVRPARVLDAVDRLKTGTSCEHGGVGAERYSGTKLNVCIPFGQRCDHGPASAVPRTHLDVACARRARPCREHSAVGVQSHCYAVLPIPVAIGLPVDFRLQVVALIWVIPRVEAHVPVVLHHVGARVILRAARCKHAAVSAQRHRSSKEVVVGVANIVVAQRPCVVVVGVNPHLSGKIGGAVRDRILIDADG